jgi:transposase, IS6 family
VTISEAAGQRLWRGFGTLQHANNPIEADHARLRPMRGLKRHRSARVPAAGHAFVQNLRRGHYDVVTDTPVIHRLRIAFDDLALTI